MSSVEEQLQIMQQQLAAPQEHACKIKCLGDMEQTSFNNGSKFLLVVEMSTLRTTASEEVLSSFLLSPCSLIDPRINNSSDTAPDDSTSSIGDNTSFMPSRIFKHIFHLMDTIPVSKFHSYSKEFKRLFRDALFVIDEDSSNNIDNIFYKAPYHLRSSYSTYIDFRMEQVFIQVSNASSMFVVESANRTSNRPEVRHVEPTNLLFFG
ncbi:hypothetical protein BDF21DRAFT_394420 [Thamnidium elegans]|nr:hypothetical protein BDF21DRAFT_394420 [Thamnidium elegans]